MRATANGLTGLVALSHVGVRMIDPFSHEFLTDPYPFHEELPAAAVDRCGQAIIAARSRHVIQ